MPLQHCVCTAPCEVSPVRMRVSYRVTARGSLYCECEHTGTFGDNPSAIRDPLHYSRIHIAIESHRKCGTTLDSRQTHRVYTSYGMHVHRGVVSREVSAETSRRVRSPTCRQCQSHQRPLPGHRPPQLGLPPAARLGRLPSRAASPRTPWAANDDTKNRSWISGASQS